MPRIGSLLVAFTLAVVSLVTPPAHAALFQTVRSVKQVSADPFAGSGGSEADTEYEPHIAVDPNDPSIVVAVVSRGRFTDGYGAGVGFATSHDGGRTWRTGNLPGLTAAAAGPFERGGDPVVAIGPDGAVYAQTLLADVSHCRTAVAVQRSDDGGLSFSGPVLVQDNPTCSLVSGQTFNDKGWIAVDTFPSSPYYGRVYVAWTTEDQVALTGPVALRHSDDRGATWSGLVVVSPLDPLSGAVGAIPLVGPSGDLTIVYNVGFDLRSDLLQISRTSHDGGEQFDPPVTIALDEGSEVPGMRTAFFGPTPAAAVDPVNGDLYASWQDGRFRTDGGNDVVLTISTDGGATWGPLRVVSEAPPVRRFNEFTPAVAAYGGVVIVTYGSRGDDDNAVHTRYVVSEDSGATFSRARSLGAAGNLDFAATANGAKFLGDYTGLALTAASAHAVWCRPSRRQGSVHHQTTWTATIDRRGLPPPRLPRLAHQSSPPAGQ